jgi:Ni/Co efflux regulator RcnB
MKKIILILALAAFAGSVMQVEAQAAPRGQVMLVRVIKKHHKKHHHKKHHHKIIKRAS